MYSWPSVPPPLVAEPMPYWLKSEILWFAVNINALPEFPLKPKSITPVKEMDGGGWLYNSILCTWHTSPLEIPHGVLKPILAISFA